MRTAAACIRSPALFPRGPHAQRHFELSACLRIRSVPAYRARALHSARSIAFDQTTIFALSTAPGRSAIAVVRISGPAALHIYRALCPGRPDPKPRYASIRSLLEPGQRDDQTAILDSSALVLYFPAPRTVTGEDVLELHLHGGPAIVRAVLNAIPKCVTRQYAIRYAEPGEFTKRAFLNGRLDLTQAEALGDTLSATTEQQRRLSVQGTTNSLAKRYDAWRQQLLLARGELEALIDFSEDQHFDESPDALLDSVAAQADALIRVLKAHVQNAVRGELLRNGIAISLLGAPNAGKSSLLNRIVGREAAIVSQEAGTTRDVVEVGLDLGGYFCRLGDTAGLRNAKAALANDPSSHALVSQIEEEGMRRAKERAAESDVVVVVLTFQHDAQRVSLQLDPEVIRTAAELVRQKDNVIVAINKTDIVDDPDALDQAVIRTQAAIPGLHASRVALISCQAAVSQSRTGGADPGNIQGLLQSLVRQFDALTAAVAAAGADPASAADGNANANTNVSGPAPAPAPADADADASIWQESLGASARHRLLLERCIGCLDDFIAVARHESDMGAEADIVVAAEHLRSAAECLAKITGRGQAGDVEEVLGVVFEKFCVGK